MPGIPINRVLRLLAVGLTILCVRGVGASQNLRLEADNAAATAKLVKTPLPIFFFHGIGSSRVSATFLGGILQAQGRLVTPLTFCENTCSVSGLNNQVQLAIAQIRSIVNSDSRYDQGYIFIGHSQGGVIARAVVEEMDDHNVYMLLTLATPHNGVFFGPQVNDQMPTAVFINYFGPLFMPGVFDYNKYISNPASLAGPMQFDVHQATVQHPEYQNMYSLLNLARSPVEDVWIQTNKFLAVMNNLHQCADGDIACVYKKQQRKRNFQRLQVIHSFFSPDDEAVSPYQTSQFGKYSTVATADEIVTKFAQFHVVDMKDTVEYQKDTYGLKSHDLRGTLHFHSVPNVAHSCWVADTIANVFTRACSFRPIFDQYVAPVLAAPGCYRKVVAEAL